MKMTAESFLQRTIRTLQASKPDPDAMKVAAEEAAQRLASGGRLWVSGMLPMVREFSGRAGGFMMLRMLDKVPARHGDVIVHFPAAAADPPPDGAGNALIISLGVSGTGVAGPSFPHHAQAGDISPTLATVILGWVFTGELIAALTRLGKMPVIYGSIGMYDGVRRMQRFKEGEITFHADLNVPPVIPGALAARYLDLVADMLSRVEREEQDLLIRAAAWAREARSAGKRLFMYSMGHLFPDEIGATEIGRVFHSAIWNAGFPHHPRPNDAYHPGDLVIHIGYQHPPDDLLLRARPAGARAVYVSLRSDRDFVRDPDVIWIDPMWDWPDACVSIEGYDVPVLAASAVVNAAIAWEIYHLQE